ncbi:hypothetical protein Pcinc_033810 [Petrolisthes cinctipes]|uniref:CUB domain-containing protein n=1 Tax=Petrolisthes cinctipes TaxID=88211 RepID=A0AAE1ERJ5_PETCI|nr:hypothetical protein Pcinc_033810 [Petrolisthes cinctipes]
MMVSQEWGSPRFIAYYNFPHMRDKDTGDLQRGGSRLEYTECDWLYEDVDCSRSGGCQMTSPGYPGLYPAPARCRYLLVMSSPDTRGRLTFHTLDLHPQ